MFCVLENHTGITDLQFFVCLSITQEGSIPEIRISSILLNKPDFKMGYSSKKKALCIILRKILL